MEQGRVGTCPRLPARGRLDVSVQCPGIPARGKPDVSVVGIGVWLQVVVSYVCLPMCNNFRVITNPFPLLKGDRKGGQSAVITLVYLELKV